MSWHVVDTNGKYQELSTKPFGHSYLEWAADSARKMQNMEKSPKQKIKAGVYKVGELFIMEFQLLFREKLPQS